MLNSFIRIVFLLKKFLINYCTKEYQSVLEGYTYSTKRQTYILNLRVRNKQIIHNPSIQQALFDKNLLKMLHPMDAYIVVIIYGIYKNKVIMNTDIMSYFGGYQSYHIIEPNLFIVAQYIKNEIDYVALKTKNGTRLFRMPILEFCDKPFLLHAIGSEASRQLGFFISEKFISEIT